MADWNPELYNRFRNYRAEPVEHIFERLKLDDRETIVDLGCGPGENTVELVERSIKSTVRGIDRSPAMIEAANALRAKQSDEIQQRLSFTVGDMAKFDADREYSIVFSNAALQWLPDQRAVLTNCFRALTAGGQMVMQMPANEHETGKLELNALALEPEWRPVLGGIEESFQEVGSPEHYARILTAIGFSAVDCYYHTFRHPMQRPGDVVEWYRATGLRPFMNVLPEDRHAEFLDAYRARLERAYRTTGPITFNFRRLFLWGRRRER
jgi:trans-aconitate 2-methyltransferase